MREGKAKEFRAERANELRQLALVLIEEGVIRDQEPLLSAAAQAGKKPVIEKEKEKEKGAAKGTAKGTAKEEETGEFWGYNFTDLQFSVIDDESSHHARPDGAMVIDIHLSVSLLGRCLDDDDFSNPFSSLGVDIVAFGLSKDGKETLKCAWHFDKHIQKKGDGTPVLVHPIYHFQHGGNHVSQLNDYGKHLILESPRIAHPPLDAVLAVDFILSNYCGRKWADLRSDNTTYKNLIASAQERYWTPYAYATAAICNSLIINSPWNVHDIWPQMLIERVIRRAASVA